MTPQRTLWGPRSLDSMEGVVEWDVPYFDLHENAHPSKPRRVPNSVWEKRQYITAPQSSVSAVALELPALSLDWQQDSKSRKCLMFDMHKHETQRAWEEKTARIDLILNT